MGKEVYYPLNVGEIKDVIVGKKYVFVAVGENILLYNRKDNTYTKHFYLPDFKKQILAHLIEEAIRRDYGEERKEPKSLRFWAQHTALSGSINLSVSEDEERLVCCFPNHLIVIRTHDGEVLFQRNQYFEKKVILCHSISQSGNKIAIAFPDMVEIHDLQSGEKTVDLFTSEQGIMEVSFSPNEKRIAVLSGVDVFDDELCEVFSSDGELLWSQNACLAGFDDRSCFYSLQSEEQDPQLTIEDLEGEQSTLPLEQRDHLEVMGFAHGSTKSNDGRRFLCEYLANTYDHYELDLPADRRLTIISLEESRLTAPVPSGIKGFGFSKSSDEIVVWTESEITIGNLLFEPLLSLSLQLPTEINDLEGEARNGLLYLIDRKSLRASRSDPTSFDYLKESVECLSDDSSRMISIIRKSDSVFLLKITYFGQDEASYDWESDEGGDPIIDWRLASFWERPDGI